MASSTRFSSGKVPVARFETRVSDARGGLHVRVSPDDSSNIDVKVFDGTGLQLRHYADGGVRITIGAVYWPPER